MSTSLFKMTFWENLDDVSSGKMKRHRKFALARNLWDPSAVCLWNVKDTKIVRHLRI